MFVKPGSRTGVSGRQALSQVEQMLASACFRGSDGRLGCTSCHDPHGLPDAQTRVDYYRTKCLACHASRNCSLPTEQRLARQPSDSCIACHMAPSLQLANILHVSFADHRILREPHSEPDGNEADSWTAAQLAIFDHADERVPKLELDRAVAFMLVGGSAHTSPTPADARRAEKLLLAVHQAQPADVDTLEVLGAACLIQRRDTDAESWFLRALELDPLREQTLFQLAIYYHERRQIKPAEEYLKRFLAVNPWRGAMFGRYASVLAIRGQWRECIAAGERGLELNPTQASLHELLAYACEQAGELAESERHQKLWFIRELRAQRVYAGMKWIFKGITPVSQSGC